MNRALNTPVILIIFKRPDVTRLVFNEIARARPKTLMVIADGPRADKPGDEEKCIAARSVIKNVDWNCEVLTNYSDVNMGCENRVATGLNWVFGLVEEAIILEDDCVPDHSFFAFCNELLEYYRNDSRVMAISGDNFQDGNKRTNHSYYFSRFNHCWGWASWRRAWKHFDLQMKQWPFVREEEWLIDILQNNKAARYWHKSFQDVYENKTNSWAIRWTFACWLNSGLTILPNTNLISNIGFGENATHTKLEGKYGKMKTEEMKFPLIHPPFVIRDAKADLMTERNMFSGKPFFNRVCNKIVGMLK